MMATSPILLHPLGLIHTPNLDPESTPIQPCFAQDRQGEIHLDPAYADGLEGLAAFSHVFLIYQLHRAVPGPLRVKPYLSETPMGIFACRYPHRPNTLGLSLVRILGITGSRIRFEGADMLDGTPLLDLKPYYPMADHPGAAWGAWTEGLAPATAWTIGSRQGSTPAAVGLVPTGSYLETSNLPCQPLD